MTNGTLQAALFEALDAIRAGYPEQAVTACNELLAYYPDSVRVFRVRAQAYEGMQDWQHASEDFNRVLDIVPTDANAIVSLARTMNMLGRTEEAQLIARQALDYAPTDEDALVLAQNIDDGDPNALKPPQPGRVLMMRQQFEFGRISKALESLRKFTAERPHRIDARMVLAELLWRSNARIAASELCQQILDEQPDCLPAHILLSMIWAKLGATRVSEAHLRALGRLDPDHRETREWLGERAPVTVTDVLAKPEPAVPAHLRDTEAEADDAGAYTAEDEQDSAQEAALIQAEHDDYVNGYIVNYGPIEQRPAGSGSRPNANRAWRYDDGEDANDPGEIAEDMAPLQWERQAAEDDEVARPSWLNSLEQSGPPIPEGAPGSDEAPPTPKPRNEFRFELTEKERAYVAGGPAVPEATDSNEIDEIADDGDDIELSTEALDTLSEDAVEPMAATGMDEAEDEALAKTELSMLPVTPSVPLVGLSEDDGVVDGDSTLDSDVLFAGSPAAISKKPDEPEEVATAVAADTAPVDTSSASDGADEAVEVIAPVNADKMRERLYGPAESGTAVASEALPRPERRIRQQSDWG